MTRDQYLATSYKHPIKQDTKLIYLLFFQLNGLLFQCSLQLRVRFHLWLCVFHPLTELFIECLILMPLISECGWKIILSIKNEASSTWNYNIGSSSVHTINADKDNNLHRAVARVSRSDSKLSKSAASMLSSSLMSPWPWAEVWSSIALPLDWASPSFCLPALT